MTADSGNDSSDDSSDDSSGMKKVNVSKVRHVTLQKTIKKY